MTARPHLFAVVGAAVACLSPTILPVAAQPVPNWTRLPKTALVETKLTHQGRKSLFMKGRCALISRRIAVKPGQKLRVAVWVRGFADKSAPRPTEIVGSAQVLWDGRYQRPYVLRHSKGPLAEFQQTSWEATGPEGFSHFQLALWAAVCGDARTRASVWYDDVEISVDGKVVLRDGFEDMDQLYGLGPAADGEPTGPAAPDAEARAKPTDAQTDAPAAAQAAPSAAARTGQLRLLATSFTGFGVPGHGAVAARGERVYVPPGEGDFTIVDVSDKRNPRLAGFIRSGLFSSDVFFYGTVAYAHNSRGGTFAVDLDAPRPADDPEPAFQRIAFNERKFGRIAFVDEKLGVLVSRTDTQLSFFSLDDPLQPALTSQLAVGAELAFSPASGRAVCAGAGKILAVDFSTPAKPATSPLLDLPEGGRLVAVSATHLALRCGAAVEVHQYAPGPPKKVAEFALPDKCSPKADFAFHERFLYVVDDRGSPGERRFYTSSRSRFLVYDLAAGKPVPCRVTEASVPSDYRHITIAGDWAYISDCSIGLRIFDLSDPARPVEVGAIPTANETSGMHLDAERRLAFNWATFGGTIHAFDVSDPERPRQVGWYWDGAWVNYVFSPARESLLDGAGAMLYCGRGKLAMIDASDPGKMKLRGFLKDESGKEIDGNPLLRVRDGKLYVLASDKLLVYDLSDPAAPRLEGKLPIALPRPLSLQAQAGRVYALLANSPFISAVGNQVLRTPGLAVIDVRDPAAPALAAILDLDKHCPEDMKDLNGVAATAAGCVYITFRNKSAATNLLIVDAANPYRPKVLGIVRTGSAIASGWASWCWFNTNMTVDETNRLLFVCKYGQVEAFDISRPRAPTFLAAKYLKWFQWTIGPKCGPHLYVPGLRGLYVVRWDEGAPAAGAGAR